MNEQASLRLALKIVPGASKDEIVGYLGERLKVRLRAAPESGRANEALLALLISSLGLSKDQVALVAGHHSPLKTVEISGVRESQLCERIHVIIKP